MGYSYLEFSFSYVSGRFHHITVKKIPTDSLECVTIALLQLSNVAEMEDVPDKEPNDIMKKQARKYTLDGLHHGLTVGIVYAQKTLRVEVFANVDMYDYPNRYVSTHSPILFCDGRWRFLS